MHAQMKWITIGHAVHMCVLYISLPFSITTQKQDLADSKQLAYVKV